MRIIRIDDLVTGKLQCTDKGSFKLRKEVERAAQEGDVTTNGFAAGQAADGLVDHRLKN